MQSRKCGITAEAMSPLKKPANKKHTMKTPLLFVGLDVHAENFEGSGELHSHGRGALRALLVQASKRLLTTQNPFSR
jgi:hypothetical protein